MKNTLALAFTGTLLLAGYAFAGSGDQAITAMKSDAISMAQSDLDTVIAASGQWRVIDKATGGAAVDLQKLLEAAKKKAKAGETEEANRMAAHVSNAAKSGLEQAQRYAGAKPYYN